MYVLSCVYRAKPRISCKLKFSYCYFSCVCSKYKISVSMDHRAILYDAVNFDETKNLWVFGYGSLCWYPGFDFKKAVAGYITGYSRKFWQGNNTHRGTEDKPGRVATLITDNKSTKVHGIAFQISDDLALTYLSKRECELGGYVVEHTTFYPAGDGLPLTAILYIATSLNSLWLGEAPLCDMAKQITESSGPSGHNVEYVLRLANFMRIHFPGEDDDHLFGLEKFIKFHIEEKRLSLKALMGCGTNVTTFVRHDSNTGLNEEDDEGVDTFPFSSRMADKTLRCLNI